MLSFEKLRLANILRKRSWDRNDTWSLSDWGLAMIGEAGEACNVIKKINRNQNDMVGNLELQDSELKNMLGEELADTVIYIDLLAQKVGIDLSKAIVDKFNKISEKHGFQERL